MNRQQRRLARRGGDSTEATGDDIDGAVDGEVGDAELTAEALGGGGLATETRVQAASTVTGRRRTNPKQFVHEVNVEMRKVAWPTRSETANYATVVFVTLVVLMALIFGLDLGFSNVASYLFK